MSSNRNHLLLVDDEPNILRALRRMLVNDRQPPVLEGLEIEVFESGAAALAYAETHVVDLVISDYRMPGMDGVDFLAALRARQPDAARILLTGYADLEGVVRAINQASVYRFVSKPWNDGVLKATVAEALETKRLAIENRRLADEVREQRSVISRQELELRRIEAETPGITRVRFDEMGGVLLED